MHRRYIDVECKDLISNIFTYGLKKKDLYFTNFYNRISLNNTVNKYLNEKEIDVFENQFGFKKSKGWNWRQKIVVGVLNKIRYTLLDYYLDHNSIVKLHQQYQLDDTNSVLNKYLKDGNSVAEIMDQNETLRNGKKSLLEFINFELKIYTIF